jgi:hypothetical protein
MDPDVSCNAFGILSGVVAFGAFFRLLVLSDMTTKRENPSIS